MLPSVIGAPVFSPRSLDGRRGGSRRSDGLRNSGPPPGSDFFSVSEYLSLFRYCLDGQRIVAIPGLRPFRARSRPNGVDQKSFASPWRKRCRALYARKGDVVSLENEAAAIEMQFCGSFCELGYFSRSAALLPAVRRGSTALSRCY